MSVSLKSLFSPQSLHLEYFIPGQMNCSMNGAVHRKTVPDVILAQVLEGRYGVECGKQSEILTTGEVFVVPANHPVTITHYDSPAGRFRSRWVHMRFSWMGVFDYLQNYSLPLAVRGRAAAKIGRGIGVALQLLGKSGRRNPAPMALEMQINALRILQILCQASSTKEISPLESPRLRLFHHVLQDIRDHPDAAYSVPLLARKTGLSTSHFYGVFKTTMGISPMHYVWKVRLESAARLLLGTNDTMAQIAEKTGFSDAFHFSHKFKTTYGLSPREYRQEGLFTMLDL